MVHSGDENRKSVLFIVRGGENIPSCRFRAYQFRVPFEQMGVHATFIITEKSRNPIKQIAFHIRLIPELKRHRAVVFQKLLEPWRLRFLKVFNKNLFFDFDDAMYADPKDGHRFAATISAAPKVIAGNSILGERARRYNPRVFIVPTVVSLPGFVTGSALRKFESLLLSWIGTAPNLAYLKPILIALDELYAEGESFVLSILTDNPAMAPKRSWIESRNWTLEKEQEELQRAHVGLMPLPETEWCRGKCACKALQYLSHGKYVLTSPVGVNEVIFSAAPFGILCRDTGDWKKAVKGIISDHTKIHAAVESGPKFVREQYELNSWAARLTDILFAE